MERIDRVGQFSLKDIFECGQVFRYIKLDDFSYKVISLDKMAILTEKDNSLYIDSADVEYFKHYLDLDRDYLGIINKIKNKPLMSDAVKKGEGIRILNQDPFEMLISFIISANNHIPRIKSIIERISNKYGKNMGEYYAFPTALEMRDAKEEDFSALGCGYRASYLQSTIKAINDGFDIKRVSEMDSIKANKYLCNLKGIGPKVADCILLFGFRRMDVFPVDTWIKKIYKDIFQEDGKNIVSMSKRLVELYGDEYAGYAQQYLYYRKRNF